jgi:hypothetical protein
VERVREVYYEYKASMKVVKAQIIEKALSDILMDIERFTEVENAIFNSLYADVLLSITEEDPYQLNFKLVDIDQVIEMQSKMFLALE